MVALALCLALLPLCAGAEGALSAEEIEYVMGELGVPRDVVVTDCMRSEPSYWEGAATWLVSVELYSNGTYLAGASLIADDLTLGRSIMPFDPYSADLSALERRDFAGWTPADAAYLKGAFGIPWSLDARCEVGEPYYWDGGGLMLTQVDFYAGDEHLAGAAIEADSASVSMVRNIYTYSAY